MLSLVDRKRRTRSNSKGPLHFLGKLALEVPHGQSLLSLVYTQKLKAGLQTLLSPPAPIATVMASLITPAKGWTEP